MHVNLKKCKKIASDKNSATFRNSEGHEFKVMLKALSPKYRGEIHAIPMADGGEVPEPNSKNAKEMEKGATQSGWQPEQWAKNVKEGLGFAKGGEVEDKGPYVDPEAAREIEAGATGKKKATAEPKAQGEGYSSTPIKHPVQEPKDPKEENYEAQKKAFNAQMAMADGGNVQEVDYQNLPQEIPQPQQQAPVTINIGQPQAQQPAPEAAPQPEVPAAQSIGHRIGDFARAVGQEMISSPTNPIGQIVQAAQMAQPALEGTVQGMAGQPLAPIPTMDQGPAPAAAPPADPGIAAGVAPPSAQAAPAPVAADPYQAAMQKQMQGLEMEAAAAQQAAQGKEKALADYGSAQQESTELYDANIKDAMDLRQQALQALQEGKIDPDRYWNNRSTGGKISTILGIIAAGFNPTSNPNAAIDMLNKEIDRDIDTQKMDLGRKQGLLSAANDHFRNIQSAADFHRVLANDLVSHKIDQAIAKAGTPMAQAALLKTKGALEFDTAKRAARFGAEQTLSNPAANPASAAKALKIINDQDPAAGKDYAAKYVPGMGLTTTPEGGKVVRETQQMVQTAQQGINDLLAINKQTGKSLSPETRAKATTIQQSLVGALRLPITGPGAMNEGERKMLENLIANPTAIFSLDNSTKVKLETLSNRLQQGLEQSAKTNGLTVRKLNLQPPVPNKR